MRERISKTRRASSPRSRDFNPLRGEDWDWFCRHVLPELAAFESIAASGNRAEVATTLDKTAAGVSRSIPRVERELAAWIYREHDQRKPVDLIDHQRRGRVVTTDAGKAMLRFVEKLHSLSEDVLSELYKLHNDGQIQVATINSAWNAYGQELIKRFTNKMPNGQIALQFFSNERYNQRILREVIEGRVDVGITSYPPKVSDRTVRIQELADQEMVLVVPSSYPRHPKTNRVCLSDVVRDGYSDIKIVLYRRSLDIPGVDKVWRYLRAQDSFPKSNHQLVQIDNFSQGKQRLEEDSNVISILPRLAVTNEVENGSVKIYSLDPPMEPWSWGIIYRVPISRPAVQHFVDCFDWLSGPTPLTRKRQPKRR